MHWCFMGCMRTAFVAIAVGQISDLESHFQYELFSFALVFKYFCVAV